MTEPERAQTELAVSIKYIDCFGITLAESWGDPILRMADVFNFDLDLTDAIFCEINGRLFASFGVNVDVAKIERTIKRWQEFKKGEHE